MIETHGIYIYTCSGIINSFIPSMSLIIRSSELARLLQLKFTQPRTSVHGRLLFRPTATRPLASAFAATLYHVHYSWSGSKIQTSYWSIMMSGRVKLPTTVGRRREGRMAFFGLSPNHCYVMLSLSMHC